MNDEYLELIKSACSNNSSVPIQASTKKHLEQCLDLFKPKMIMLYNEGYGFMFVRLDKMDAVMTFNSEYNDKYLNFKEIGKSKFNKILEKEVARDED